MLTDEQQAKLDEIKHNPAVHWNNQPNMDGHNADWIALEMQQAILRTLFDVRDLLIIQIENSRDPLREALRRTPRDPLIEALKRTP